jgi:hypothetical protein
MTIATDSKKNHQGAPGVTPPDALQAKARAFASKHGAEEMAAHCGLSPEALMRVLAGVPVRAGTLAQVEVGLGKPLTNGNGKKAKKAAKKS